MKRNSLIARQKRGELPIRQKYKKQKFSSFLSSPANIHLQKKKIIIIIIYKKADKLQLLTIITTMIIIDRLLMITKTAIITLILIDIIIYHCIFLVSEVLT